MDKYIRGALPIEDCESPQNARVAEAVRTDFTELLAILERQLGNIPPSDSEARLRIEAAKAAAERGVELSERLLRMLGAAN